MTPPANRCRIHDVAIIGGGPAGCVAALQLARGGADVLVLERRTSYERRLGETLPPACSLPGSPHPPRQHHGADRRHDLGSEQIGGSGIRKESGQGKRPSNPLDLSQIRQSDVSL